MNDILATVPGYERFMFIRFNDGEVLYVKPGAFKLIEAGWDAVVDYYSVYEKPENV